MSRTLTPVLFGFINRPHPQSADLCPDYSKLYKKEDTIAEKRNEYLRTCHEQIYSGEIHEAVVLFPPENLDGASGENKLLKFTSAAAIGSYILANYSAFFDIDGEYTSLGELTFFGFNPRLFVKQIGLSSAEQGLKLPPALWYGSNYYDAQNALVPSGFSIDLQPVVARMLPEHNKFQPPGTDARSDLLLSVRIAKKLNLFPRWTDNFAAAEKILADLSIPLDKPKAKAKAK